MVISQRIHDEITELELRRLIEVASKCDCPPDMNCYCAKNLEWAERKLAELKARSAIRKGE